MDVSVLPIAAVGGAAAAAHRSTLQPGQLVEAVVARVIDAAHVQLALNNTLLDVLTEVPLAPGARVQLSVQATTEGLKLVLTTPDPSVTGSSGGSGQGSAPLSGTASRSASAMAASGQGPAGSLRTPVAASAEGGAATTVARPAVPSAMPVAVAAALSSAVRAAAVSQSGLAPLMADAAAAATLPGLPAPVRQAVTQLLSLQLPADQPVAADQLRRAFARSGLFLEANLEAAALTAGKLGQPAPGDLKSALLALRAALVQAGAGSRAAAASAAAPAPGGAPAATAAAALLGVTGDEGAALSSALASLGGLAGASEMPADLAAVYRTLLSSAAAEPTSNAPTIRAAAVGTAAGEANGVVSPEAATSTPELLTHANPPAPPYRGALPAAQPAPGATVDAAQPLDHIARVLLAETDGALARQTLLQAASLPDQNGLPSQQTDAGTQRWAFEIPIATPQGPAIAQFEIAGDRKGRGSKDTPQPIWRARFAVDIEPLGPVHAHIAVMGERTAVALWAERPASAALLRDQARDLNEALRAVELEPLEVVVRDGAPRPLPAKAPAAGHFLDCAS